MSFKPTRLWMRPRRLIGHAMLVILAIVVLQVAASLVFYEAIDRQTIHEDHARRVAELLVVSNRIDSIEGTATPGIMTTRHLNVSTASRPTVTQTGTAREVSLIKSHILAWEPELAERTLALDIENGGRGRKDLVGSMALGDGRWLNFRSQDISSGWPIALRATVMTLFITLLCLSAGLYSLRFLGEPLQRLSDAAEDIGQGKSVALVESGPPDLRNLARSFNHMQARIAWLVADQAKSFEAISHDLRTPLSRLQVASDFVEESDIAQIVRSSADEMEAMLMSLQRFLRAQHLDSAPEDLDLVAETRSLLSAWPGRVTLDAPDRADAFTYRDPLLLALQPLVENALQYGDRARVKIADEAEAWVIEIADDGPGIPEDCLDRILDPFFRVDSARARDTAGFGLGIPTAHRLLQRFGGNLRIANAVGGGLVARVTVPRPSPDQAP